MRLLRKRVCNGKDNKSPQPRKPHCKTVRRQNWFNLSLPSGREREQRFNNRESHPPDRETVGRLWPSRPPAWAAGKAFEWSPRCFQRSARCLAGVQTGRAHREPAARKYSLKTNTETDEVIQMRIVCHWYSQCLNRFPTSLRNYLADFQSTTNSII